jgi:hypothetical protein
LWLLDGILQLRPEMFGQDFVNNVLVPLKAGHPAFLVHVLDFGIRAWNVNAAVPLMLLVLPAALSVTVPYRRWAPRFAFAPSVRAATQSPLVVSRFAEVPVEADDRGMNS